MVLSSLIAGAIWMFSGYVLYLGFQYASVSLAKSPAPMGTLADVANIGWYSYVVDLSLSFTIGVSLIAIFSWVARFMYTMSSEGVAPKAWRRDPPEVPDPHDRAHARGDLLVGPHRRHDDHQRQPARDVRRLHRRPQRVSAPARVRARRRRRGRAPVATGQRWSVGTVAGVCGVAGMAFVLYENLVPFPGWPTNLAIALFLGVTVGTTIALFVLRRRRPSTLRPASGRRRTMAVRTRRATYLCRPRR